MGLFVNFTFIDVIMNKELNIYYLISSLIIELIINTNYNYSIISSYPKIMD